MLNISFYAIVRADNDMIKKKNNKTITKSNAIA